MPNVVAASAGGGQYIGALRYDFTSGQVLAVGAAAVASAPLTNYTVACLTSTTDAWYSIGGTAAPHVAGSDLLPAHQKFLVMFPAGAVISVIEDSAAGFLSILPARPSP